MIQMKDSRQRPALESYGRELQALLANYEKKQLLAKELSVGDRALSERLAEGKYLLQGVELTPDPELGQALAYDLLDLLQKHFAEAEGLGYLRDTFVSQEIKCPDFLLRALNNDSEPINNCVQHYSLDREWIEYFGVYLSRPYRRQAAKKLLKEVRLSEWKAGYCPVCGHWPGLTKLLGHNEREFWCCHCSTIWNFPAHTCPYCLGSHTMAFQIFARGGGDLMKALTCSSCRGYVKSYRPKGQDSELSPDVAWLATLELDEALATEGYMQVSPLDGPFSDAPGEEFAGYWEDLLGAAQ